MKLLKIQLMNSCDRNCYYCPAKKWMKPVGFAFTDRGYPIYMDAITNEALLKWLKEYINPNEWILEFTGGEPSLYKEIDTLVPTLNKLGYKGIIRTHGGNPIPKSDNFRIVTAWHEFWGDKCPTYYDLILIIKNPNDDWRKKLDYCISSGIPYKTCEFDESYAGREMLHIDTGKADKPCVITHISYISSMGQLAGCQRKELSEDKTIFNMSPPDIISTWNTKGCEYCIHEAHVQLVLQDDLFQKCEDDYKYSFSRILQT